MMGITKKRVFLLIGCVLALCLTLTACGGGSNEDPAKNFTGSWKLYSMDDGEGYVMDEDDLAMLEELGMSQSLALNEDKTAALVFGEDSLEGTWEAKDATAASITFDDQTVDAKLEDGKLSMESDGAKLVFVKSDAAATSSTSDDAKKDSGESAVAMDPITLADDEVCSIVVTGKKVDWADDPGYELTITNKTEGPIYVYFDYGSVSVNDKMATPYFGETIQAGKYVDSFMYFSHDEVGEGLEALVNVTGTLAVDNNETHEALARYEISLD